MRIVLIPYRQYGLYMVVFVPIMGCVCILYLGKDTYKGIDIPSFIGAPIQATGDGVVEFSGWGGGYGWLIIVLHDYGGFRTVYAHLSERLVSSGMTVKKGQIIGRVGNSGNTTGPHVHYEIRQWNRATSPKKYLDLDLFTAGTRLW